MDKFFDSEGMFFRVGSVILNIAYINLLWILCSLPIITIGASTTSAYYVAMKVVKGEEGKIANQFFGAFKENFLQSTIAWIIFALYGAVLAFSYRIILNVPEQSSMFLIISVGIMTIVYIMLFFHVFPMIARYKNTLYNIFKNSLIVSIRFIGDTVLIMIMVAVVIFIGTLSWNLLGIFLAFGVGLIIYISSIFVTRSFSKLEKLIEDAKEEA